jgi:O-antigen ligase
MLFELTGKDATFTGRTAIWKILLDMIAQRPMTGYGPGMSERPEFMEQIQGRLSWDAKGSHNSYLDLLVNYGYPETILLLFIVLKIFFASFAAPYFSRAAIRTTVLSASIVFVVLVMSFTNASALFSRSIFSVLLIASTAVLAGYQQKVNIEARGTRKIREEYAPAS